MYERKNQMIFKLGNIQVPLTGSIADFDGTMMLSKCELALTNSMIQVNACLIGLQLALFLVVVVMFGTHSNLVGLTMTITMEYRVLYAV